MNWWQSITKKSSVIVIAEAGVNHNGNLRLALKLVDAAVEAGADAVKFQTFKASKIIARQTPKVAYQQKTTDSKESMVDMISKLELSLEDHQILKKYCKQKGIEFMSTPFDQGSVDLLQRLKVGVYKIPSGEITNIGLLQHISKTKKPIILSTGMSNLEEVKKAVQVIKKAGNSQIALLHCISQYPTPFDQMNLRAMNTLKDTFKLPIGLSDHSVGIWMPIAAVAMGAKIIEKHITLDKSMEGPDHKASLDPQELKEMIKAIRVTEQAMGSGIKKPASCEMGHIHLVRKCIVASKDLSQGQILTRADLEVKRAGHGLAPELLESLIGRRLTKAIVMDMPLTEKILK